MGNKFSYIYNGVEYKSKKDCCLSLGLSYDAIHAYMYRHDLDFNTALNLHIYSDIHCGGGCGKSIKIGDKTYDLIKSCCKDLGLSYHGFLSFIDSRNIECDETGINEYIQYLDDKSIVYNGIKYSSLSECCSELGLHVDKVRRFKRYHNLESDYEALFAYIDKKSTRDGDIKENSHEVMFEGVTYSSQKECCESLGVSKHMVKRLKSLGYDFCDAVNIILARRDSSTEKIVINGVEYDSLWKCCKSLNLNQVKVTKLSRDNNLSIEDAILMFLDKKRSPIVYNGKTYKSISQLCKDYNIPKSSLYSNYRGGACERIDAWFNAKSSRECVYNGITYKSLKECCDILGINYNSVCAYKSNNDIQSNTGAINGYLSVISSESKPKIVYCGISYKNKADLANNFGLNVDCVSESSRKYNIDFVDALDWYRLRRVFDLPIIKNFIYNDIFSCRCKNCGKEFLFTKVLVFKHIEECYYAE